MNRYTVMGICLIIAAVWNLLRKELKRFRVVSYTIPMQEAARNKARKKSMEKVCRFAFLADLHGHSFGQKNEELIAAIDEAKPDFIICGGDMMVAKPGRTMDNAVSLMKDLSEKYTIYYGNGNHEYRMRIYPETYKDMYDQYKKVLDSCKIHHLINEKCTVQYAGRTIDIFGLEIDRKYYKRFKDTPMKAGYIAEELGEKPNNYTILIAHNPIYFQQYADWGAELTLSGHIHGGIINLPKFGGMLSPQFRFFPKYDGGVYKSDRKYMILSRGLGNHTIPIRIRNRAELIVVDLVDEKR